MSPLGNVLIQEDGTISAQLAARVDTEVSHLVDQAYETAKRLLEAKKERLVAISEHLIEVETIDGSELDEMLFGEAPDTAERITLEELAG
jgi:cell division protease FtsH